MGKDMAQIAVQIAFYKTQTETRGPDVLKALGAVKQDSKGEYVSFTYGNTTYPICAVIINRDPDGYNVYIEKEAFLKKNKV